MKHKHKFYPTNDTIIDLSRRIDEQTLFIDECGNEIKGKVLNNLRKWVCECGAVKWVREKEEVLG